MNRALLLLLGGCANPTWQLSVAVDPPLDLPSEASDGCSVTVDALSLSISGRWLEVNDRIHGTSHPWTLDLEPVRQYSLPLELPVGRYASLIVASGAPPVGATVEGDPPSRFSDLLEAARAGAFVVGRARCDERSVTFSWTLPARAHLRCAGPNLELAPTGELRVPAVARTDVLFEAVPGELSPRTLVDADLDGDGELTLAELRAIPLGPTGWAAGPGIGTLGHAIAERSAMLLRIPSLSCVSLDPDLTDLPTEPAHRLRGE